jgi:capsular polysaccharide transport system permease protein
MENDERIRKWREERGGRTSSAADLDADRLVDADIGSERRSTGASTARAAELPDDYALEDARIAILERRRIRWRLIARRVLLFVAIPLLVVLLYIGLIATPLYQAEAVFTVQTSSSAAPSPTAGIFSVGGGGSTIADAFKAREFILSRPMMEQMEKRYGFMSHFASSQMDPLTRFDSSLGINQEPYHYYLKRVRVAVDVQEGILHLYVQARTPEDAVRFGNAILSAAETHVNAFSEKISSDQISALSRDVQNAERQVADSRQSLAAVQARRGELSPEATATAVYQLISQLELQLAEAKRERDALLDQGLTDSPLLPRLSSRVEELQAQIAEQRGRLVNPGGGSIARTLNEYESASSRKEIAQARWQSTLNTLQQAYLRILEDRRYFVIVVGMSAAAFPAVRDILGITWPLLGLLALIYAIALIALRLSGRGESLRRVRLREMVGQWRRR